MIKAVIKYLVMAVMVVSGVLTASVTPSSPAGSAATGGSPLVSSAASTFRRAGGDGPADSDLTLEELEEVSPLLEYNPDDFNDAKGQAILGYFTREVRQQLRVALENVTTPPGGPTVKQKIIDRSKVLTIYGSIMQKVNGDLGEHYSHATGEAREMCISFLKRLEDKYGVLRFYSPDVVADIIKIDAQSIPVYSYPSPEVAALPETIAFLHCVKGAALASMTLLSLIMNVKMAFVDGRSACCVLQPWQPVVVLKRDASGFKLLRQEPLSCSFDEWKVQVASSKRVDEIWAHRDSYYQFAGSSGVVGWFLCNYKIKIFEKKYPEKPPYGISLPKGEAIALASTLADENREEFVRFKNEMLREAKTFNLTTHLYSF